MLKYIKDKGGVGKNRVVKAIKIEFAPLRRRKKLVISMPTSLLANNISENIVYITLRVNNRVGINC